MGHIRPRSRSAIPASVDEATDYCKSFFLKHKSETGRKLEYFIKDLQQQGISVKYLRCDNAAENKKAEEYCTLNQLGVKFEYTAPYTPQQNGVAERKFATLWGRMRAQLQAVNNTAIRNGCWAEVANKATFDNNHTIQLSQTRTPH